MHRKGACPVREGVVRNVPAQATRWPPTSHGQTHQVDVHRADLIVEPFLPLCTSKLGQTWFLHTLGEARGPFLSCVSVCSMPGSKPVQHWLA